MNRKRQWIKRRMLQRFDLPWFFFFFVKVTGVTSSCSHLPSLMPHANNVTHIAGPSGACTANGITQCSLVSCVFHTSTVVTICATSRKIKGFCVLPTQCVISVSLTHTSVILLNSINLRRSVFCEVGTRWIHWRSPGACPGVCDEGKISCLCSDSNPEQPSP